MEERYSRGDHNYLDRPPLDALIRPSRLPVKRVDRDIPLARADSAGTMTRAQEYEPCLGATDREDTIVPGRIESQQQRPPDSQPRSAR